MERCDRCRYWTNVSAVDDGLKSGECAQLSTLGPTKRTRARIPLAIVRGPFITAESFGCVQFEERT
jgi:hypothetical protein